jgi:hypothetical protein
MQRTSRSGSKIVACGRRADGLESVILKHRKRPVDQIVRLLLSQPETRALVSLPHTLDSPLPGRSDQLCDTEWIPKSVHPHCLLSIVLTRHPVPLILGLL